LKIILTEIDSAIKRSKPWTLHREAMQIWGAALRARNDCRRLGDIFTAQQIELVSMCCSGPDGLLRGQEQTLDQGIWMTRKD
jgi:hypothetical protein